MLRFWAWGGLLLGLAALGITLLMSDPLLLLISLTR